MKQKYRSRARIAAYILGFTSLGVWLFHSYVYYEYSGTRPHQKDVASGRVYPLNNHGDVVYLSKQEDDRLTALMIMAFSLFGCGLLIDRLIVRSKSPQVWEKKQF